jgi:hypothetical protein
MEVNLALFLNEVGVSQNASKGEFLVLILRGRLGWPHTCSSTFTETKISLICLLK